MWSGNETIRVALACVALAGVAAVGAPQKRRTPVERLNADLVPFIPDPNAVLAVARVVSAAFAPLPSEAKERVTAQLEIVEPIQGDALKGGDRIEIAGKRLADEEARYRSHFDQWNVLPFESGELLAVAVARNPVGWTAMGARRVESVKDPLVGALRRASLIEHMPLHSPERNQATEEALSSPSDVLQAYAIEAVGRRTTVSREVGAGMIGRALFSQRILAPSKPALALELASRDFYHYEEGDAPVNVAVVRTLARLLVEGVASQQPLWTQILGASLAIQFSKDAQQDAAMRLSLVRAVGDPSPARVIAALEQQATRGSKDQRVAKLLTAWRAVQ